MLLFCFSSTSDAISGRSSNEVSFDSACNSGCSCDYVYFDPVCGSNDLTYFSPCHAGCYGASLFLAIYILFQDPVFLRICLDSYSLDMPIIFKLCVYFYVDRIFEQKDSHSIHNSKSISVLDKSKSKSYFVFQYCASLKTSFTSLIRLR